MAQVTATQAVGRRLREIRKRRSLSAQRVADMCAEVGVSGLNRQVITNLENGRRSDVSIDEVLTLAYVLDVPPVLLFVPVGTEDRLAVADASLAPGSALRWVGGETPWLSVYQTAFKSEPIIRQWRELAAPVTLTGGFEIALHNARRARGEAKEAALADLAEMLNGLIASGLPIPSPVRAKLLDEMVSRDLLKYPEEVPVDKRELRHADASPNEIAEPLKTTDIAGVTSIILKSFIDDQEASDGSD